MLSGCCGYGGAGEVQTSVPHTLMVVRLLVETEKRGCPRTETVGLLEHSQRELLQTKSTNVLHVFFMTHHTYFSLQRLLYSTQGWCVSPVQQESHHIPTPCFILVHYLFSLFQQQKVKMLNVKARVQTLQWKKVMHNHTYSTCTHHTVRINHNIVTSKWWAIFLPAISVFGVDTAASSKISVQDPDYLLLIRGTLNLKYSAKSKELCAPTCDLLGEETALWAMDSPRLEVENCLYTAENDVQCSSCL